MKKLFLTILAGAFFFLMGSSQNASDNTFAVNATQKVFHAIETGDVTGLDDIMDQNIVDHTMNGDVTGIDAVKNMFVQMHNHIDNLKMNSIANASDGDYHFTLMTLTGTTNSEFMGMPANTAIDQTTVGVVRTENGKAVEHWDYLSAKDAMQMMHMHMQNMHQNMDMKDNMDSTKMKP